ncbi:MAG TPA: hypothetical protein VGO63_02000 [Candidatus Paceibacterota bacterium]|jgi:hypothetical protein|nr:hypothetical protein [Candidatus Paceibacterota bacterium]
MSSKQIIILVVVILLSFVGYKIISSKSEVPASGYLAACRNACESVGWNDKKFNNILRENDGLSNLCGSYYCSENEPSYTPIINPTATKTFYGYDCKGDCSGHEAGYKWAENKNITDEDECGGNSNSFKEGCKAYVTGDINFGNNE